MAQSNTKPTHQVNYVTGEGDKAQWTRVGVAWEHEDGEGFNLALNFLPLVAGGRYVVRKIKPQQEGR